MNGSVDGVELPPGLLEAYLESARAQLGALAGLAERLAADAADREALELLRGEAHRVRGSAGSYGFQHATALAAEMEETAKQWLSQPYTGGDRGARARRFVTELGEALGLGDAAPATRGTPTAPAGAPAPECPDVILVEDDAALVELLDYGLRSRGYRFAIYRNGRQALDALLALETGGHPPLVLLDVDLPALDGYAVFDALQRRRPGAFRVVFTTVHGTEEEQVRGLEAGAVDYLVKPISLRVALEKIRRWVGR